MVVDALGFALAGRELTGTIGAAGFARLCQGLPEPQDGSFTWALVGRTDTHGARRAWLDVRAEGEVRVVCQRCLEPFVLRLRVDSTLGLLDDPAQLDAMDALETRGEGPEIEYLVADPRLDVLALIEDELILALPLAPRHEVCPGASDSRQALPDSSGTSPFAVLERLRKV